MQCRKAEILPLPQKTSPIYLVSTLDFTEIGIDMIEVLQRFRVLSLCPRATISVLVLPEGLDATS